MTSERLPGDMPSSLFEAFVKTPEVCARDDPRTITDLEVIVLRHQGIEPFGGVPGWGLGGH